MDVDMRSESARELKKMNDASWRSCRRRSTRRIARDPQRREDRGRPEADRRSALRRNAGWLAARPDDRRRRAAFGLTPTYTISSTDANIPISLGIPAVTIGRGGTGGRAHALDEWIDVERKGSVEAVKVAMTVILAVAGVQ